MSLTHSTHEPLAPHLGVGEAHCASLVHVEVHVSFARLQNGVPAGQFAFDVHWTHVFVDVLQTCPSVVHSDVFAALHCLHAPATQAGSVAVGHGAVVASPLLPSHAVHAWLTQTGAVPEHWVYELHWTHVCVFVVVSQKGVVPVHADVLFVASGGLTSHCTQAPVGRHAGRLSGHVCVAVVLP